MAWRRYWSCLVTAVLVCFLLAGFAGGVGGPSPVENAGTTQGAGVNITSALAVDEKLGPQSDPLPLARVYGSPYDTIELEVAVTYESDDIRDMSQEVEAALEFWETNAMAYVGYPVAYEVIDTDANSDTDSNSDFAADVHVEFEESIDQCGAEISDLGAGCADFVRDRAPEQVSVRIQSGMTFNGTIEILIHEFGHTLGVAHGEVPSYYMQATMPLSAARPDVGVEVVTDGPVSDDELDQITHALEFLENHPDLGDPPTYRFVDQTVHADVVVHIDPSHEYWHCGHHSGSCVQTGGYEYDDQFHIATRNLDTDALGWHVGRNLALAVFDDGELPEELHRDRTYQERRMEWWD